MPTLLKLLVLASLCVPLWLLLRGGGATQRRRLLFGAIAVMLGAGVFHFVNPMELALLRVDGLMLGKACGV